MHHRLEERNPERLVACRARRRRSPCGTGRRALRDRRRGRTTGSNRRSRADGVRPSRAEPGKTRPDQLPRGQKGRSALHVEVEADEERGRLGETLSIVERHRGGSRSDDPHPVLGAPVVVDRRSWRRTRSCSRPHARIGRPAVRTPGAGRFPARSAPATVGRTDASTRRCCRCRSRTAGPDSLPAEGRRASRRQAGRHRLHFSARPGAPRRGLGASGRVSRLRAQPTGGAPCGCGDRRPTRRARRGRQWG